MENQDQKPEFDPRKEVLYYDHEDGKIHRIEPKNPAINPVTVLLGLLMGLQMVYEPLEKKFATKKDMITPAVRAVVEEVAAELNIKYETLMMLIAQWGYKASFMGVFASKEGEHCLSLFAGIDPSFAYDA